MTTNTLKHSTGAARLLSADDPGDVRLWDSLVDSASTTDVYYRPGYARAYQTIGHGKAAAALIETPYVRALFPFLLRPLNALPFAVDEQGYDAATPYGYGGLLLLDGAATINADQVRELLGALRDWGRENQVVSAHVRLHPVLRQEEWFAGALGEDFRLQQPTPTIAINLRNWRAETASIATLKKGRRSDLSFARRHLQLTWSSDGGTLAQDVQLFHVLYEQRMTELEASEYYHFPLEYYQSLAEELGPRLDIAIAWLNGEPVGAALVMTDRKMAHYHLSATNDLGRSHKATTLILNAAAERARLQGCECLHLGGGANGEDPLFAFKQSFGGEVCKYSFLAIIIDRSRYGNLVVRRMAAPNLPALRMNFFPEYRA
jgi:Acetyltransferase (GNAT) domain